MVQNDLGRRQFLAVSGATLGSAAIGLLLAGCGDDSAPTATGRGAKQAPLIKAAGGENGSSGVMRQALKLAAAELGGASVELANMAQGTALLSVRNNSAQCAMMSWVNLCQARDNGVEAVAIAPAWASHASIMVATDSPYQTVADLKGKRVGSAARTSGVYSETRAALKDQGIDIETDLKLQPIDDGALLRALFLKGDFDAIVANEPAVSQLLADNDARDLLQVGAYEAQQHEGRFVPVNSWGVRQDWVSQHDAKALQAIFRHASELAKTSKEPYDLAAKVGGLSAEANDMFFERFSKLVVTEFTDQNLQDAQVQLDEALAAGLIKSAYQVTDLVLKV
jgi:ABC-type nitrate/sulfonate/bicarbonate transport system substrate-binding protein